TSGGCLIKPDGLQLLDKPNHLQKQLLLIEPKTLATLPVQLDYFDLFPEVFHTQDQPMIDVFDHLRKEQHGLLG
ncbi:MAG: hypothetical protein GX978_00725, partial [Tissierellia bacterium]|nr:hypothetical protein [Tissierellia bacterium]